MRTEETPLTNIVLTKSTYAHRYDEQEMIHRDEYTRILRLISQHISKLDEMCKDSSTLYNNTISVFGERGTGKTSFLHSVIEGLKNNDKSNDIEILGFIDPTMMEEKEHIFLLVISLINKLVEDKLKEDDCKIHTNSFQLRARWQQRLMKMAKGLPALDKVGESRQTSKWQSHEFIMEKGLDIVYSAYSLEVEFRGFVELALEILKKKCFVLVLDDIDVDMKNGWDVLEMLRKYITTPRIIPILSGNLKLYSLNIRKHQWEQLEKNRALESGIDYVKLVNELEGQYLLKVLQSENRIHLKSLLEYKELRDAQFYIMKDDKQEDRKEIYQVYSDFFASIGIKNPSRQRVFINYMLGISIRSQIQFLLNNAKFKEADSEKVEKTGLSSVEAFLSRLYAANVDVNLAVDNAQMLPIIIQRYLEGEELAPDMYQLIPNVLHKDVNACLIAFTILFAKKTTHNNFLIFDYMIRIGYVRNMLLGLGRDDDIRKYFYRYAGLNQVMSLRNNVGLSIGFSIAYESQLASHIALYAFSEKNKQSTDKSANRVDSVLKETGLVQRLIGYLPVNALKFTEKNESRIFYSFYSLLAVIAEVLKIPADDNQKELLKSLLMNMQTIRTYPVWSRTKDNPVKLVEEVSQVDFEEDIWSEGEGLDSLEEDLIRWGEEYKKNTPPYLLGVIMTRLYYTLHKIRESNLGNQMNRSVIAFLNACLIEECLEYYVKTNSTESIDKLNLSNAVSTDKVFLNNLSFVVRNNARSAIGLTEWMMRCPFLQVYLDPVVLDKIIEIMQGEEKQEKTEKDFGYRKEWSLYEILQSVEVKSHE